MFAKLLKMEFRSTWNVLGILCLSLVGAGLLGGLATRYLEAQAPRSSGWKYCVCWSSLRPSCSLSSAARRR